LVILAQWSLAFQIQILHNQSQFRTVLGRDRGPVTIVASRIQG
jgi:hypothetical protein